MTSTPTVYDATGTRQRYARRGGKCPRPQCGQDVRHLRTDKKCPECGITRPADAFSHNPSRSDHLDSRCRPCVRSHKHAEAADAMPDNPLELGAILGNLHEHISSDGRSRGGYSSMRVKDAWIIDYRAGTRTFVDEVWVNHRENFKFPFRISDRVTLAFSPGGYLGKVLHIRSNRVPFEDEWPDMRLSLVNLFKQWYPAWSPPPALHPWSEDEVKFVCPLAAHADRTGRLSAHGEYHCSRHTGSDYWTAVDVLTRRFGVESADAAVAELSRIENLELAALADEVWAA